MQNKLDKKYYVWIWLGLVFASFVRNIYSIYSDIAYDIANSYTKALLLYDVIMMIISYGLLPVVITFVEALVLYYITARRHSNYISRNDFCYWIMLFTIGPHVLIGIIECFAILNPTVYVVTQFVLNPLVYPLVYLLMFIFIFDKQYHLNPVERNNSFSILATIYMVFYGIEYFFGNITIVSLGSDSETYNSVMSELSSMFDVSFMTLSDPLIICSAIAICIFFAYLITVIVLGVYYKKQAQAFRNEDTRDGYYQAHPEINRGYHISVMTCLILLMSLKESIPKVVEMTIRQTMFLTNSIFNISKTAT